MASKRNYLIFEDAQQDLSLRTLFDVCVSSISEGTARVSKTRAQAGYPSYDCFRVDGREILIAAALEYYLFKLGGSGFEYEKASDFAEAMRKLCGWQWEVDRVLRNWVERVIRDSFFEEALDKNGYPKWVLKHGEPSYQLPEDYLRFACYIAICHVKYGPSESNYTANQIFGYVADLGNDLPAKLKKVGSGDLPKELAEFKDSIVSYKANDVFATIKITLKEESEDAYQKVLELLCQLLEFGFSKSYTIDFRSPEKSWLPIKGLPKIGVHQLFSNAIQWPALHKKIEDYARLAMKEFEWYENLEAEYCAMPGTFAVFALGLYDEKYHALVCNYLRICDGEHQGIQGNFILAYIEKYGFAEKGLELYALCKANLQHLPKKLKSLHDKQQIW